MDTSKNDERRKFSRVEFATRIQIILEVDGRVLEVDGSSKDLSLKGVFVNVDESFAKDTACRIKIQLTGGIDKIELNMLGRIARTSDRGAGIVFDSMDVDSYSHLKNIVRYNTH